MSMDKNWTKIYSTGVAYKVELFRGLLLENDIESVIVNKQDSAYLFGEIELYVKADEAVKAKHIITTHEKL